MCICIRVSAFFCCVASPASFLPAASDFRSRACKFLASLLFCLHAKAKAKSLALLFPRIRSSRSVPHVVIVFAFAFGVEISIDERRTRAKSSEQKIACFSVCKSMSDRRTNRAPKICRQASSSESVCGDADLLGEIFKHLDAESLAVASCVCRKWKHAAFEESLWEIICTRLWPSDSPQAGRLKTVVSALGGFRKLYIKRFHTRLSQSGDCSSSYKNRFRNSSLKGPWSKDEVHLSLSLFSVECYERLAPSHSQLESSKARTLLDGWTTRYSMIRPKEKPRSAEIAEYCWGSMDSKQ